MLKNRIPGTPSGSNSTITSMSLHLPKSSLSTEPNSDNLMTRQRLQKSAIATEDTVK